MTDKQSYQEGFWFAVLVLKSMGLNPGVDAIADKVKALAAGTDSLMDGPLDTIRAIEQETGKTLPESLRQSVHRHVGTNRAETETGHRASAAIIVEMFGG